jgi:hypothetical protein
VDTNGEVTTIAAVEATDALDADAAPFDGWCALTCF